MKNRAPFLLWLAVVATAYPALGDTLLPTHVWPASYTRIDEMEGGADRTVRLLSGGAPRGDIGEGRGVAIPFPFTYLGQGPFTKFNVGSKGYITFGDDSRRSDSTSVDAINLVTTANPSSVIAAWWGDHHCDPESGIKLKTLGTAPARQLVIEWQGCSMRSGTVGTTTTFAAQIWLAEGSNAIRVAYGDVEVGVLGSWSNLSWGLKGASGIGALGPDAEGSFGAEGLGVCNPLIPKQQRPICSPDHFPARTVIQYGRSFGQDMTGSLEPGIATVTGSRVDAEVELTLFNLGQDSVGTLEYDLYLAPFARGQPGSDGQIVAGNHLTDQEVESGGSLSLTKAVTLEGVGIGLYHVCAHLDPSGKLQDPERVNNWICSRQQLLIGPDLTGSITGPSQGGAEEEINLSYKIRNQGNAPAGISRYVISLVPSRGGSGISQAELHTDWAPAMAPGQEISLSKTLRLPALIRGDAYHFELKVDADFEIEDADRSNNTVRSPQEMASRRPRMRITRPISRISLPEGCFYGEPIEASFEVCNEGDFEAVGAFPGVMMSTDGFINRSYDVTAASFPAYCGEEGSWNHRECAPIAGRPATCAFDHCRAECEQDADCASAGLACVPDSRLSRFLGRTGVKSCGNRLTRAPNPRGDRCRTYHVQGRIPMVAQDQLPYTDAWQYFVIMDDVTHSLSQPVPDMVVTDPYDCRIALVDLEAAGLKPPDQLRAGQVVPLTASIHNPGFTNRLPGKVERPDAQTFSYQYFLSPNPEVSIYQLPLPMADGLQRGSASIRKGEWLLPTDLVRIPANVAPGEYFLGLILDPDDELEELEKSNNVFVLPQRVQVGAPSFQIVTDDLPRATLGALYSHPLVATAGAQAHVWSGEHLPPGMQLDTTGILSGVPTAAGTYAFTAKVSSGAWEAERVLALQVLSGTSALQISTRSLPPGIRGATYAGFYDRTWERQEEGVHLAATGGQPPYRWELDPGVAENRLPDGLEGPSEDGWIRGAVTRFASSAQIAVRVMDSLGRSATASFELMILDADDLAPPSGTFPTATTARDFDGCVEARGGQGSYQWEVDSGTVPAGLEVVVRGAKLCLVGRPLDCSGHPMVHLQVEDDRGQRREAAIPMRIECGLLQLDLDEVRPVSRGEVVDIQLGALPSKDPSFRLHGGRLPEGLELAPDGRITGTVGAEAGFETHQAILELWDVEGRRSLAALTMSVVIEEKPVLTKTETKPGCASAGAGSNSWLLVLLVGWAAAILQRRRPGETAPPHGRATALVLGAGLLAAVLAAACGDEVHTTASRCLETSCGEGFACDEADGHCKCGGMICEDGAECELEPAPHCVTPVCDLISCDRGMSCDNFSGECRCGDEPCAEDELCVAGVCQGAEATCKELACDDGFRCDEADGLCKCGEVECGAGASCIDDACVENSCFGVTCDAGSVCNPADGRCHCGDIGGPICILGEICQESADVFSCQDFRPCDLSSCDGGTVCDPDDGECRCGGVGPEHPVCAFGQSCLDGQCRGEDLCNPGGEPLACGPGLVCDPTDGMCKCGGRAGELCEEGEACTFFEGRDRCVPACTPLELPASCAPEQSCFVAEHGNVCLPIGHGRVGMNCSSVNDCIADHHCTKGKICAALCRLSFGVDFCRSIRADLDCVPFDPGGDLGYCRGP